MERAVRPQLAETDKGPSAYSTRLRCVTHDEMMEMVAHGMKLLFRSYGGHTNTRFGHTAGEVELVGTNR